MAPTNLRLLNNQHSQLNNTLHRLQSYLDKSVQAEQISIKSLERRLKFFERIR